MFQTVSRVVAHPLGGLAPQATPPAAPAPGLCHRVPRHAFLQPVASWWLDGVGDAGLTFDGFFERPND